MKVALVHEWLESYAGSERVLEQFLAIWPEADLFAVCDFLPEAERGFLRGKSVRTSFIQRMPLARRMFRNYLGLMPLAIEQLDLSGYDLVLSSSHACAKNVRTPAGAVHVSYCHTPIRYVWDPAFLEGERLGTVGKAVFAAALPKLRRDDLRGAGGVDAFVANSTVVADRIRRFYGRESEVVHPPVAVEEHLARPRSAAPDAPYLVFGRVVPYKRVDLAVQACARLGRPVVVAGTGRDLERVQALAGPRATFTGHVSDAELAELLATSRALLMPGEEDFGIVPVEAQAAGLPVIGYAAGGVRDSVRDGSTGVLYDEGTLEGLVAAMERFECLELADDAIRENARRFARGRFLREMEGVLLRARAGDRRPAAPE